MVAAAVRWKREEQVEEHKKSRPGLMSVENRIRCWAMKHFRRRWPDERMRRDIELGRGEAEEIMAM
jgi:hypothetical protein